jgi:hypothetical protein
MAKKRVKPTIPLESLVQSIAELNSEDKRRLWEWFDQEMARYEEQMWENSPSVQTEIQEARSAYQAGDYVSIEEYICRKSDPD